MDFTKLKQKFGDPKQEVRAAAIRELYELGSDEALAIITEKVLGDRSKSVRKLAVNLLKNIRGEKNRDFFIKATEDPEIEIRKTAISALGSRADTITSRNVLLPLLQDRSAEIRKAAIDALCRCKNLDSETEMQLLDVIKERLESADKDERLEALSELSSFKTCEVIDIIGNKIFHDRSQAIKEKAAVTLAFIFGGEEVKEWLLKALTSKNSQIVLTAVKYLGLVANADDCKNILLPLLDNDNDEIKAAAIAALCNRFSEIDEESRSQYISFLEKNIESPVEEVYTFSIKALLSINPKDYIDLFLGKLAKVRYVPRLLDANSDWYSFNPNHRALNYKSDIPGLLDTIFEYADQSRWEKLIDILVSQFADGWDFFPFSTAMSHNDILRKFAQSPRAGEIFEIIKQRLLNTSSGEEKTALISYLAFIVEGRFSYPDYTPISEEDLQKHPWIRQNLDPTIELFKELLGKQDKTAIKGHWNYFDDFLKKREITGYKWYRNEITRYLTPWLKLYGVSENELNALQQTTAGSRKSGKNPKKVDIDGLRIPIIEENDHGNSLSPEAIAALGEQLLKGKKTAERMSAGQELSKIDSVQVYTFMLKATNDTIVKVRKLAWSYIAKFDTDETYHNMLVTAALDTNSDIKKIAANFLAGHPEKDTGNVLKEIIVPTLKNDHYRLISILENYSNKQAAEILADLIVEDGESDYVFHPFIKDRLELFNEIIKKIYPETIYPETSASLFQYLKNFYSNNASLHKTRDELFDLNISLLQTILSLSSEKLLQEMEDSVAEIFVKGTISAAPFYNVSYYLPTMLCLAAGKTQQTAPFFRLILDRTRSGGNFEKAMGVMFLIAMVGGDQPGFENWSIHLDETKKLFAEILTKRENLPDYRGTEDERYCSMITGEIGSGLFPFVEKAVKRARKKIKTPRKRDIFKRNLIPWLEAKTK